MLRYTLLVAVASFLGSPLEVESFQFANHVSRLALLPSRSHLRSRPITSLAATLRYPLTQVVSDIDDTLKSSGGVKIGGVALGGIDVQYARGEFYPGVFQFMWELSLYSVKLNQQYNSDNQKSGGHTSAQNLAPPKVAVLTAVSIYASC